MSEFHVKVVQIGPITKHPNADTLSVTMIGGEGGYPVITRLGLFERLSALGGHIGIFGELYGNNAGMRYDATASTRGFRMFDAMDLRTRRYLDVDEFLDVAAELELPNAPILYRGPWRHDLASIADGSSTLDSGHVREGFVVRPMRERHDLALGRVILKRHGEAYLLKKWKVGAA